uniref:Uncharacterized protein n=1 Tax=Acrobeloides nanus TaxID=290746 RepID=A0A914E4A4_9BILA
MQVDVDDLVDVDMKKFFESTADFIKEARDQGGKCLVFCNVGMSRSATLCIMYLVIHEKLTLREAYSQVEKSRRIIAPNLGFWRQMIGYEKEKNDGNSTVEMIENAQGFMVPDVYFKKDLIVTS